jgi:O-Antigen ligase
VNASTGTVPRLGGTRGPATPDRFAARYATLVMLGALVFGSLIVGAAASRGLAAGLAAVIAVAATLWAVRNPTAGAFAVVAVVPAISGLRRGLPVPGFRLAELVAVGYSAILLLTAERGQWRRWRTFDWLAAGYVVATFAFGLLDTELRGDTLSGEDLGQMLGPLQFFLLYRAVLVALPRRAERVRALDWLLIGSLPVCALTLLQAAHVPGIGALLVDLTGRDFSSRITWAIPRAAGPFPHWTMLAGYLFAILVLCVALLLAGPSKPRRRLALVALAAASISLVLTVTIAPMIGALAGALALAWWYRRSGRTLAYLAVAGALLLVAFQPLLARRADDQFQTASSSAPSYSLVPHTVSNRIGIWQDQYLPAMQGRWLTGYGPQIPPDVTWKFTESVYLSMLLRGGLPLLVLYGAMSWALALVALDIGRRRVRAGPGPPVSTADEEAGIERALGRALVVLLAVLAVLQLIAPFFVTNGLPHVWWIVAALAMGAAAREH